MRLPNGYGSITKLSGKRRRPYMVRACSGSHIDEEKEKVIYDYKVIGYTETKSEALKMLSAYNDNPYDLNAGKLTFSDIYERWSDEKFQNVSDASVKAYTAAYNACETLRGRVFKDLRLADLQNFIDNCGKNYPTLKKIKLLLGQMYDYALKYDFCTKDYSEFVDIAKYSDKNPNQYDRRKFTAEEIAELWKRSDDPIVQTVLILIYTGVRISELLELRKEDVNLDEHYFDVVKSKTKNGLRVVPIADKVYPFFERWYNENDSEYLLHHENGKPFLYDNYYNDRFVPLMNELKMDHTPHCARYATSSMLYAAGVDPLLVKKILGHSGAMSLTEKVYTHPDVKELLDAINKI